MLKDNFDPQTWFDSGPDVHPCAVLDYNGVLDQFKGWTGQVEDYDPAPGALEFVRALKNELGFRTVIVQTATMPVDRVVAWMRQHGFDVYVDYVTNHKPPAQVYVDDRAVLHRGDFSETLGEIRRFKPHWHTESTKETKEVAIQGEADETK